MRASAWFSVISVVLCACGGPAGGVDGGAGEGGRGDAAAIDARVAEDAGRSCERLSDCDDGQYCNGAEMCVDAVCVPGAPPCEAGTECLEDTDRCATAACSTDALADADDDTHRSMACHGDDCDDADNNRYPGNPEVCDTAGHDEDCDPETYGFRDADHDGYPDARCCNGDFCGTDCDDMMPNINPGNPEVCGNGIDDNCDGTVDEGAVDGFVDGDGDGWGDGAMPFTACPGTAGFAVLGEDCDDGDPDLQPDAPEICDHRDEDCDGLFDEGVGASACSSGYAPDRCLSPDYALMGHASRGSDAESGYVAMGGTSATPGASPGIAYFVGTDTGASIDLGRSTTVVTTWDARALGTSGDYSTISTVLTPVASLSGEDAGGAPFPLPSGAPTVTDPSRTGIIASGVLANGTVALYLYGGGISDVLRVSTSALPAGCLPNTILTRRYRVALTVDGPDITATLTSDSCPLSPATVTYSFASFDERVYGEMASYPRYWIAALGDSDGTGAVLNFRELEMSRDPAPDRPSCGSCMGGVRTVVCSTGP